jgi:hypothetical protein
LCMFQKAASELAVFGFQFPKCDCNLANISDIPIDVTLTVIKKNDDLLLGTSDIVHMLEGMLHRPVTSPLVGARIPIKIPKSGIIEQELIEVPIKRKRPKVTVRYLLEALVVLLNQRKNLLGTRCDRFFDVSCPIGPLIIRK